MIKINRNSLFLPNYAVPSVLDLDPSRLMSMGITHVVFDLDSTIVKHGRNSLSNEYLAFIQQLRVNGLIVLVATNTNRDISELVLLLGAQAITPNFLVRKPSHKYFRRVVDLSQAEPKHIAMVGDHLLNDVIGGNRAGFTTVFVRAYQNKFALLNHVLFGIIGGLFGSD